MIVFKHQFDHKSFVKCSLTKHMRIEMKYFKIRIKFLNCLYKIPKFPKNILESLICLNAKIYSTALVNH